MTITILLMVMMVKLNEQQQQQQQQQEIREDDSRKMVGLLEMLISETTDEKVRLTFGFDGVYVYSV